MSTRLFLFVIFLFLFSTTLFADTVILKNGDRLTGKIVRADGKTLVINTEFTGTVTVDFSAITQINSDDALNLTLRDGQKVVGKLAATSDNQLAVETADTGKVALAKEAVTTIRSKEEEAAHQLVMERMRNPGIMDLWAGSLNFGLSLAGGNAETNTLTLGLNAARATPRDKISVYSAMLRARNKTDVLRNGQIVRDFVTTANAIRGGARYDVNVSEKMFAFGFGDLDFDEFLGIDFRGVFGGGLGYHAIKGERLLLDLSAGGAYNKTYFTDDPQFNPSGIRDRSSGEIVFGNDLTYKAAGRTSLFQKAAFFPNLSQRGEYRFNFDVGAATALTKYLSWQVTFSDRYLSNPLPGRKSNDTLFTTGVGVTFGNR